MIRVATDENFHGDVLRGLLRRCPTLAVLRVQDTEVFRALGKAIWFRYEPS